MDIVTPVFRVLGWFKETSCLLQTCVLLTFLTASVSFVRTRGIMARLKSMLRGYFVNIRHIHGHVMPGAPFRWKSYFDDVNFFGPNFRKVYGPIYYVWHGLKPVIILSDVNAIRSFYKDHFSHGRESDFTCGGAAFKALLGECLGVTHGRDKVKVYRSHFEPYFSTKAIKSLHHTIGETVDDWIKALPAEQNLDLTKSGLTSVPLRVLICATYGVEVMRSYLPEIKKLLQLHNRALAPVCSGILQTVVSFIQKYVHDMQSPDVIKFNDEWERFHGKLLEERDRKGWTNSDAYFFLLHDHIKTGLIDLSYKQLLQTADEILLLNVDITFAAASFVIYDISKYPEVQERLREEVDRQLPGYDPAECDNLEEKLPYLHMVVKESARMHPALGVTFPELTVKEVTDMAGYQVPKGTNVSIDPYSVNYDPSYWPNPETFCPERFAAGKHHVPYSFFRFGLGPRKCLGYRLAQSMIVIIVCKLLQKFSIKQADPHCKERIKTEGMPFFTPYLAPNVVFYPRV